MSTRPWADPLDRTGDLQLPGELTRPAAALTAVEEAQQQARRDAHAADPAAAAEANVTALTAAARDGKKLPTGDPVPAALDGGPRPSAAPTC